MKYSTLWRNPKSGYEHWQKFQTDMSRNTMFKSRKYLRDLGHEVQVLLNDVEIEVEDDDK